MTVTSFGEVLAGLAEEEPTRPAVTCADVTVTRAELLERVRRLAAQLSASAVRPGSTVTICLPTSVDFVVAMFAAWHVGATPQPISHRAPRAERDAIMRLADPALVIGIPAEEAAGRPALSLEQLRDVLVREVPGVEVPDAQIAPAWKMITSGGSTGQPKLIVANEEAALEAIIPLATVFRMTQGGTVLVPAPLSHNSPFIVAALGMLYGNHVVLTPKFNASETLRLVEAHQVTWLYLVPTMMLRIWRLPEQERLGRDASTLRVVYHMSAPCPPWLKREWIGWLGPRVVYELYSGTEGQAGTVIDGEEWLRHPGSVGRPLVGQIEVRDEAGRPVPTGTVGELWLRRGPGQQAPYRYIGATPRSDPEGWESLGDMGYVDGDGYIYLTDRKTDMVLVGGSNVYPAEIEAVLERHPAVRSSCVIGLPDEDMGNRPHAIIELAPGASVNDDELRDLLSAHLAPYKIPKTFERTDQPLRDDAGKVRRSAHRDARMTGPSDLDRAGLSPAG